MSSLITDLTVPPAVRATRLTAREAADAHGTRRQSAENPRIATMPYPMTIVFTVAGFIIAELVSLFFPQIAHVSFPQGQLWIFLLTGQEAYRALLVILTVVYAIAGIVDLYAADKREYYRSRAPFRFAMGVALALWDIAGTKLQTLPQPFFPITPTMLPPGTSNEILSSLNLSNVLLTFLTISALFISYSFVCKWHFLLSHLFTCDLFILRFLTRLLYAQYIQLYTGCQYTFIPYIFSILFSCTTGKICK